MQAGVALKNTIGFLALFAALKGWVAVFHLEFSIFLSYGFDEAEADHLEKAV